LVMGIRGLEVLGQVSFEDQVRGLPGKNDAKVMGHSRKDRDIQAAFYVS
jgi:hypothetical protein